MFKALKLAEGEILARHRADSEAVAFFYEYAGLLRTFRDSVTGPERPEHVSTLELRLNLLNPVYEEAEALIGKYLHRVLLGAFFKGAGYAYVKGTTPVTRSDLDEMVADWVGRATLKRCRWSRWNRLKKAARWVLGLE